LAEKATFSGDSAIPDAPNYAAVPDDTHDARKRFSIGQRTLLNGLLNVHTRVSDLLSNPYDQVREQLRLLIESVKEKQESELLNNAHYGLLNNVSDAQKIKTRKGAPTPDDLDELLTKVWKEPSLFLAHPRAIAAFGRECTRRGAPPPTVTLFGTPFLTWRGVQLISTDKIAIRSKDQKSKILLVRVGENLPPQLPWLRCCRQLRTEWHPLCSGARAHTSSFSGAVSQRSQRCAGRSAIRGIHLDARSQPCARSAHGGCRSGSSRRSQSDGKFAFWLPARGATHFCSTRIA
jgi:hypothetical protein